MLSSFPADNVTLSADAVSDVASYWQPARISNSTEHRTVAAKSITPHTLYMLTEPLDTLYMLTESLGTDWRASLDPSNWLCAAFGQLVSPKCAQFALDFSKFVNVSMLFSEGSFLLGKSWPQISPGWDIAEDKIRHWSVRLPDWYDEQGQKPTPVVFDGALSFLSRARSDRVPAPADVTLDADGEIVFRWRTEKGIASACFLPDGCIVGYVDVVSSHEILKLDEPYSSDADLRALFDGILALK